MVNLSKENAVLDPKSKVKNRTVLMKIRRDHKVEKKNKGGIFICVVHHILC